MRRSIKVVTFTRPEVSGRLVRISDTFTFPKAYAPFKRLEYIW